MSEITRFLGSHAPFDGLQPPELEAVARSIQVEFFPAGAVILQRLGTPAEFVYVVRRGSVELAEDTQVVDVLEEGELFGHPSALSGLGPAYTARAREDALCYLVPREVAEHVLGTRTGLGFLIASLHRGVERSAEVREGLVGEPRLLRAGDLVSRPVLQCEADESVRDAAALMTGEGRSALLVRTDAGYGIVTDTDLRTKVVARGLSYDRPVREVMSFPVSTVSADRLVQEVLLEMLETGMHHFPVVVESGAIVGVLSNLDILGLERTNPFELRAGILRAGDAQEVARLGKSLPDVVVTLARAGLDPEEVGHVVAVVVDALTIRLIDLALADLGSPPAPWAWMALGSEARREQALGTDQDHALVYADGAEDQDEYFRTMAERVVEGLEASGIPRCRAGVSASEPSWRQSLGAWVRTLETWMSAHEDKPVFLTQIGFDYRAIAGPLQVEQALDAKVRAAKDRPEFLWRLARSALEVAPPLGFRGKVVVGKEGERRGVLDIKESGLVPIVDLARFFALQGGIVAKGTVERLRGAARAGTIDDEMRDALIEAYHVLLETRLGHQVGEILGGRPPDNLIDPSALGSMDRARLKDAFRAVAHVQRGLSRSMSVSRIR